MGKIIRIAAIACAFLFLASGANAAVLAQPRYAFAFNLTTCGQYAEDRKLPGGTDTNATDRFYVAGWLSATNMLGTAKQPLWGDTALDNAMLWLDGYCLKHPFSTLQQGLLSLTKYGPNLQDEPHK